MVQISSAETCMSCQPPALRVSSVAATTSVKVRPPYGSPTTDAGGSALACFTVETFVIIDSVDAAPENPGCMRILSPASERTRDLLTAELCGSQQTRFGRTLALFHIRFVAVSYEGE
jgi:hypothetical protein